MLDDLGPALRGHATAWSQIVPKDPRDGRNRVRRCRKCWRCMAKRDASVCATVRDEEVGADGEAMAGVEAADRTSPSMSRPPDADDQLARQGERPADPHSTAEPPSTEPRVRVSHARHSSTGADGTLRGLCSHVAASLQQ